MKNTTQEKLQLLNIEVKYLMESLKRIQSSINDILDEEKTDEPLLEENNNVYIKQRVNGMSDEILNVLKGHSIPITRTHVCNELINNGVTGHYKDRHSLICSTGIMLSKLVAERKVETQYINGSKHFKIKGNSVN